MFRRRCRTSGAFRGDPHSRDVDGRGGDIAQTRRIQIYSIDRDVNGCYGAASRVGGGYRVLVAGVAIVGVPLMMPVAGPTRAIALVLDAVPPAAADLHYMRSALPLCWSGHPPESAARWCKMPWLCCRPEPAGTAMPAPAAEFTEIDKVAVALPPALVAVTV